MMKGNRRKERRDRRRKVENIRSATDYAVFGSAYIDRETYQQMENAMKMPVVVKGALMADAHVGYGLPIGGVVAAYNAVMPYGVGMDIGCRMCLSVYDLPPALLETRKDQLKSMLTECTRFGLAEFSDISDHELMERDEFKEISFIRSLKDMFFHQLGTSGHGNHFVDVGYVVIEEPTPELGLGAGSRFAILSHSGSRNFGAEVARHYTDIAKKKLGMTGEAGNLAWLELDSEEGQEYWRAMVLAGDYSAANHRIIHGRLSQALGEKAVMTLENHHNYAWMEELSPSEKLVIHRKGATPAHVGDRGIIPGNMISPAYIIAGKGNPESLYSASHGAGRQISRNRARALFNREILAKQLKQNGVELIGGDAEEAPEAYKDIDRIMEAQRELVKILGKFYPRIVRME